MRHVSASVRTAVGLGDPLSYVDGSLVEQISRWKRTSTAKARLEVDRQGSLVEAANAAATSCAHSPAPICPVEPALSPSAWCGLRFGRFTHCQAASLPRPARRQPSSGDRRRVASIPAVGHAV